MFGAGTEDADVGVTVTVSWDGKSDGVGVLVGIVRWGEVFSELSSLGGGLLPGVGGWTRKSPKL